MNKEELMVGDWVEHPADTWQWKTTDYGLSENTVQQTEGVLLEHSILLKNGFESTELDNGDVAYSYILWHTGEEMLSFIYDSAKEVYKCNTIKFIYVHQLQQLMRLCGLVKQANKFKL